jgi:hypothetical protein
MNVSILSICMWVCLVVWERMEEGGGPSSKGGKNTKLSELFECIRRATHGVRKMRRDFVTALRGIERSKIQTGRRRMRK